MKRGYLVAVIASLALVNPFLANAEPVTLDTSVTAVTVYPEWAYVTRAADVKLTPGENRLVLEELPAWIDEDSIRVKLSGPTSGTIVGVTAKSVFLRQYSAEDVRTAEEAVVALEDRKADIEAEIAVLEKVRHYYEGITPWKLNKIPHESAVRQVNVDELSATGEFLATKLIGNVEARTKLERSLRALEPELNAKRQEFQKLESRAQLEQKQITVALSAEKPGSATLSISYLISGASWYPSYDARATADGKSVELTCKAVVQQSTGENWEEAAFTLSTIQPFLVREKPELEPWFIQAQWDVAQQVEQQSGSFRNYAGAKSQMAEIQRKQVYYNDMNPEAFQSLQLNISNAMEVVRQVEERGTTVELPVAGKYGAKTDGKPVLMTVGQANLASVPRYTAVPAVSGSTYVTGQMRNHADFPFRPQWKSVTKSRFHGRTRSRSG